MQIAESSTPERKEQFHQLFEKAYAPLCLFAKQYIHERNIREDIVTDVFINAWNNQELDLNAPFMMAYLKQAVRNNCLNAIRHDNVVRNHMDTVYTLHSELDGISGVDKLYDADELYGMLMDCLRKLPKIQQKVFTMHVFDGMLYREIAEELGISEKAVYRHKHKVMSILRKDLSDFVSFLLLIC